jgi:selenocysteine-specific elongation factor
MRRLVLGTAGHIDHGKTTLVHALTGVDTDRLPEEKRRGITIDLGFAELLASADLAFSIVDVPGHESFIRNMVAGASGIDMVLLVVAADEGVMPQTREHLAIVELLGIERGVVVLTKADLVDDDWLELVRDDVAALLRAGSLRDAPVVVVSARTGRGIDALLNALRDVAAAGGQDAQDDLFRMPVDRVFTVRGTGTVVTGTVWSGRLRRDAQVRLLPSGERGRVRSLQQHSAERDEVHAGTRAAIALTGVERDKLARGETVVVDGAWNPGGILTVALRTTEELHAAIRPRQRVRVHLGTAEVLGRIGMVAGEIVPGSVALAQLRLEEPVLARAGDRFVVRSYSPVHTIAGGIVLEADAVKRRRPGAAVLAALDSLRHALSDGAADGHDSEVVLAAIVLAGADGLERRLLPIATGLPPRRAEVAVHALRAADRLAVVGDRLVESERLADARHTVLNAVKAHHERHPMLEGMARESTRALLPRPEQWLFDAAVEGLLLSGALTTVGNQLAAAGHEVHLDPEAEAARDRLEDIFARAALEPPELGELPVDLAGRADLQLLLRLLETGGSLLRLSATRWIHPTAVLEGTRRIRAQFDTGQAVGVSDLKDVLKLSRKHLIPLLEHYDRTGVTRREGDLRVVLPGTLSADG